MNVPAKDLMAGDQIGNFVVCIKEEYSIVEKRFMRKDREVPMVRLTGISVLLGRSVEDGMTFAADAMVTIKRLEP